MTLPETLPRATPDDEGPFLIEVASTERTPGVIHRWWLSPGDGTTDTLGDAHRYTREECEYEGCFDSTGHYPVLVPSEPYFDLSTRLGRVQAAWWLRDLQAPQDVMSAKERRAYGCALIGDDACNPEALGALVKRYGVKP